jgi:predicted enzyme related to lactoylglutathione lyase
MTVPAFNSVAWFEFGTDRPEEVKAFYGDLFDWKYVPNTNTPGVTYQVLMAPVSDSAGFTFPRLQDTTGNHFGVLSAPAA